MYMPINSLAYPCIKIFQRDKLLHAYNEPISIYSAAKEDALLINALLSNHPYFSLPVFCFSFLVQNFESNDITVFNYPSCNFADVGKLQFLPLHIRTTKYLIEKFVDLIETFEHLHFTNKQFIDVVSRQEKIFDNMICTYNEGINLRTQKKFADIP